MLPTFLVVGAARAGTTSLYHYLKAHPDIYMSPVKEPHFFAFVNRAADFRGPYDLQLKQEIIRDEREYRALFGGVKGERAMGECSNSYLYFQDTAGVIKERIPGCRIIILLRDPVSRAYSHYLQGCMIGHEHLGFREALWKEAERERLNWRWHYQYVKQGLYYEQVRKYVDVFGRSSVRIYLFDDLAANAAAVVRDIYGFLGVDQSFVPRVDIVYNRTGMARSVLLHRLLRNRTPLKRLVRTFLWRKGRGAIQDVLERINYDQSKKPEIMDDVRTFLLELFRRDIVSLASLIGRDLSRWLGTEAGREPRHGGPCSA